MSDAQLAWRPEKYYQDPLEFSRALQVLQDLMGDALVFEASKAWQYNYQGLRQFSLTLNLDGQSIQAGQVELDLMSADQSEDFSRRRAETEAESRHDANRSRLFWLFLVPAPAETLIEDFFASQKMIERYNAVVRYRPADHWGEILRPELGPVNESGHFGGGAD
jgi:hypothetical protein